MATSDHPDNAVPDGSSTLNDADDHFRSADPDAAIRKSTHSWIPEFAVHAIRGTDTSAGNVTAGDGTEQPWTPVSVHTLIRPTSEFVQKHLGFIGSMRIAYTLCSLTWPVTHEPPEHMALVAASKHATLLW